MARRGLLRIRVERRPRPPLTSRVAIITGSVIAALGVNSVVILQAGVNPLVAYFHLFEGALGSQLALTETFVRFTPLLLTGTAVAIAFIGKFWNIGAEGQLYFGGLLASFFGVSFRGAPSWFLIPLMVVAGFLGGGCWAFVPGILKAKLHVDEVVTTLLGNWIVLFLVGYIVNGPWRDPVTNWPESPSIAPSARFPVLVPGSRLHLGILIALAVAVAFWIILKRSAWGLELKIVGANAEAARVAGISVTRTLVTAAILSGGIAGLAGVAEVAGIQFHMKEDLSPGFGYTGIVIAMLGGLHPVGVVAASFFLSIVVTGSEAMHRATGVPWADSEVIQGITLIVLMLGTFLLRYRVRSAAE